MYVFKILYIFFVLDMNYKQLILDNITSVSNVQLLRGDIFGTKKMVYIEKFTHFCKSFRIHRFFILCVAPFLYTLSLQIIFEIEFDRFCLALTSNMRPTNVKEECGLNSGSDPAIQKVNTALTLSLLNLL